MCVDACKAKGMNENSKGEKVHTYELGKERKKEMIKRSTEDEKRGRRE